MPDPSEDIANEILLYLQRHPHSSDTLSGIPEWWITENRIAAMTEQVQTAIDKLVSLGLLLPITRPGNVTTYRLNQSRRNQLNVLSKRGFNRPNGK